MNLAGGIIWHMFLTSQCWTLQYLMCCSARVSQRHVDVGTCSNLEFPSYVIRQMWSVLSQPKTSPE